MKRKVKIVKQPTYGSGGLHTGDQANYGLYRGGGQLQDYLTGPEKATDQDVRVTYPEVPRSEATIEVERGEYIVPSDMTALYKAGGEKHSKGGTPVYAKGGEYVVSDFVTMPAGLQEILGFEASSKKKKDNTIAALLGKKVDAKEYNRLSKIIQDDLSGKDVDQYELATARNRMPLYQQFVSKAALGGELSKALQGKEFQIPAIAQPALESLKMPSRLNEVESEPLAEAKMGGVLGRYQKGNTVPRSKVDEYVKQGWKLESPNLLSRTTTTGGSSGPGATIRITGMSPYRDFDYVMANPEQYPSFLTKSKWSEAPEDLARQAWDTWSKTANRPVYIPGTSKKEELAVVDDDGTTPTTGTTGSTSGTTTGGSSTTTGENTIQIKKTPDATGTTGMMSTGQTPNWQPGWTSGAQPWWTQNVLQTGLLAADLFNQQNIYPWEPSLNFVAPTPTFRSPRQAIAAIQSQASSAGRAASLLAGPQRLAATLQGIQAQTIPGIVQASESVNAANQQVANQFSAMSAEIANRLAGARAESAGRMYDKTTMTRAQARKETRDKTAALLERGIIPGMTAAQKTSWLDALSKYHSIDPRTGTLYFTGGKDLDEEAVSGAGLERDIQTIQRLKQLGLSGDEAIKYVTAMNSGGRGSNAKTDALIKALMG